MLDLETRSQSDVTECGVYRLAEDPTLRIISIHWAVEDGPAQHWRGLFADGVTPESADPPPFDLWDRVRAGEPIGIWNAAFDRHVWNAVAKRTPTMPTISVEQCRCIATLARAHNLPAALKSASTWLPLAQRKMANTSYYDLWRAAVPLTAAHGDQYRAMLEYGDQDVTAMRALAGLMLDFSPELLRDYQVSEAINDRGIGVDLTWCRRAVELKAIVEEEVGSNLRHLTSETCMACNGTGKESVRARRCPVCQGEGSICITSARQPAALREWVLQELERHGVATEPEQFERVQKKLREDRTGYFSEIRASFNKEVRRKLRLWMDERGVSIPAITALLDLVDEGSGAAWSKYAAALDRTSSDGALRGMYILNGAAQTGRYASVGLQTHNLVRDVPDDPGELIQQLVEAPLADAPSLCGGSVSDTLGRLLRPTLVPRKAGRVLLWGDWSAIEARVCPWLSASPSAEPVLTMFCQNADIYLAAASDIVGRPVTDRNDPARQLGKVAVLSLGFGGGAGAYTAMARNYGVEGLPLAQVQDIVRTWREANPWATDWWQRLETAARTALRYPGEVFEAGRVSFAYTSMLGGSLTMWLPCGRPLFYPAAEVRMGKRFEDEPPREVLTFVHAAFGRVPLWYGQLAENATQGTAASLLRRALSALEGLRWAGEVVGHTHDEIIVEAEERDAAVAAWYLREIMQEVPEWAPGLPLAAEVKAGYAYYEPAPELLEAS